MSCPLQKERRILQNRRLDLDACKARLKKAKAAEAKAAVTPPLVSLPVLLAPGRGSHGQKLGYPAVSCVWQAGVGEFLI